MDRCRHCYHVANTDQNGITSRRWSVCSLKREWAGDGYRLKRLAPAECCKCPLHEPWIAPRKVPRGYTAAEVAAYGDVALPILTPAPPVTALERGEEPTLLEHPALVRDGGQGRPGWKWWE